jgi:BON domain
MSNWADEDRYWRAAHATRPYALGVSYDVLGPGYRFGYESAVRHSGRAWDELERDLEREWDRYEHRGQGTWAQVQHAVRDAWNRAVQSGRAYLGATGATAPGRVEFARGTRSRDSGLSRSSTLIGAAAIGAGIAFAFDPAGGRRRRAQARGSMGRIARRTGSALRTTGRDLANRTRGLSAAARRSARTDRPDSRVLVERVRAQLGRVSSHPGAIDVEATAGCVALSGAVLASEHQAVLEAAHRVRGVSEVLDCLTTYEQPGHVPGLQGSSRGRWGRGAGNGTWTPATQLIVGSALSIWGLSRRDVSGLAVAAAGAALAAQAARVHPAAA